MSADQNKMDVENNSNKNSIILDSDKHIVQVIFNNSVANAPSLCEANEWNINKTNFIIITGCNGVGKTHLLNYLNDRLLKEHKNINVVYHEADYNYNSYSVSNSQGIFNPYINNDEQIEKLINDVQKYFIGNVKPPQCDEIFCRVINNISVENINNKIDIGCDEWKNKVRDMIRFTVNCGKISDIRNPFDILYIVFKRYSEHKKANFERLHKIQCLEEIYNFYCIERNLNPNLSESNRQFMTETKNKEILDKLIDTMVTKKLPIAPWEEMNIIFEKHKFKYCVCWEKDNIGFEEKIIFRPKIINSNNYYTIPPNLSSGEKLILNIYTWLYYHQGLCFDNGTKEFVGKANIILLDEPDKHLDPELCKLFYEIVNDEFVQKQKIQVIMTTHKPDTVHFAQSENVFILEDRRITCDKQNAISRMTKNLRPTINNKDAISALTKGLFLVEPNDTYVYQDD
jgi:energy-coupling factor transporter ATP-binding protein EcfA2